MGKVRQKNRQQRREAVSPFDQLTDLSTIRAAGTPTLPDSFRIEGCSEAFELQAEAAPPTDGKPALKRFSMLAYSGGPMYLSGFSVPVVADLQGMKIPRQNNPVLMAHNAKDIVGHSDRLSISASGLNVAGVISNVGQSAEEVKARAAEGFQWQVSIGASIQKRKFIPEGQSFFVNGKNFDGPVLIAQKTTLGELSFVSVGADQNTSAAIAASRSEGTDVNYEAWLTARGYNPATITDQEKTFLKAAYDFEQKPDPNARPVTETKPNKPPETVTAESAVNELRAAWAAEKGRLAEVEKLCAGFPEICAKATGENWSLDATRAAVAEAKLEKIRAERPTLPGGHFYSTSTPELSEPVLEAAVLQAAGCQVFNADFYEGSHGEREGMRSREKRMIKAELDDRYPDQVQQAAHKLFKGRIGLQQVLTLIARSKGYHGPETISQGNLGLVADACMQIKADGSSTISVQNLTANVMNKFMLEGFLFTEQSWRDICAIRSVKDFKPTKSINLFGDFEFKDVPNSGELVNAQLQDQAFANRAKSRGIMLTIPRTLIINDDLGGFGQVPRIMGRGAGLKLNKVVWANWLNPGKDDGGSTNFFAATHTITGQSANSNLSTGAGSALTTDGLTAATKLFDNQIDPVGNPLGMDAEILLYPPDLQTAALQLMQSETIVMAGLASTAAASIQPSANIFRGRFRPVKSRYLNKSWTEIIDGVSTAIAGSTAKWWLLANPAILAAIEIAFLNGNEMPMVQTAGQDFQFNILGMSMRAFFDMDANMQNFRAAVQSNGS